MLEYLRLQKAAFSYAELLSYRNKSTDHQVNRINRIYYERHKLMNSRNRLLNYILHFFLIGLVLSIITLRLSVMLTTVKLLYIGTFVLGLLTIWLHAPKSILRRPRFIITILVLPVILSLWMITGDREPDVEKLRNTYIRRLHSFEGTKYVWGGENSFGIDCSGLARTALWQAMLEEGMRQRNPRLLGPALWKFWWRDLSAHAMRDEAYGYTKLINETPKLAGYDSPALKPGDLAVMNSGIHVLIYIGDGKWIEAAPEDRKTVVNEAPENTKRSWFRTGPVRLMRWWILE